MELHVIIRMLKINNVSGAASVNVGTTLNLVNPPAEGGEDGGEQDQPQNGKPGQPTTPRPPTPPSSPPSSPPPPPNSDVQTFTDIGGEIDAGKIPGSNGNESGKHSTNDFR